MTEATQEQRKTPWQAIILAVLFFGPLAAAWLLYFHSDWRPGETAVHGELINPAVPLPELAGPGGTDPLRGHWSLLYVSPSACGEDCREALYRMRQTDTALGRRGARVETVMLPGTEMPDAGFLNREHPDLIVLSPESAAAVRLEKSLPEAARADGTGILVVDPLGNLMMRFDLGSNPKGMYEDLKKLLRVSRIG
jgi:cytochrome oxidase Cu insertion factor (SCO1/SenC/PrrC family)